jgi:hypothetical protein
MSVGNLPAAPWQFDGSQTKGSGVDFAIAEPPARPAEAADVQEDEIFGRTFSYRRKDADATPLGVAVVDLLRARLQGPPA